MGTSHNHSHTHHPRRPPNEVSLTVSGMHCTNCALSLERHLAKVGAEAPAVDFATGRTTFKVTDTSRIQDIVESISRLGYKVAADSAPTADTGHHALLAKTAVSAVLTLPLLAAMFTGSGLFHSPLVQGALATPVFLIGLQHFGLSGL